MNATHTPGPWLARLTTDGRWEFLGPWPAGGDDGSYWLVARSASGEPTDEANARLIAAAPDLLACLRRMCGMYGAYSRRLAPLLAEDHGTVWTFERANSLALEAIAKAEGAK